MKTEIFTADKSAYKKCAEIIRQGGVVAFPTETVYGLGANAFCENAVKKIFEAKGRPSDNPIIVHTYGAEGIDAIAREITPLAKKLIAAFMPGPITIVLKKREEISNTVSGGLDTVGIRIPSNTIAREFIRECGVPIAAPSANVSSRPSPTEAAHVFEDFNGKIPAVIDGGRCEIGIESTVVDACGELPAILRPGRITKEDLIKACGGIREDEGKIVKSPGVKYRHYAPKCECVLIDSHSPSFISGIYAEAEKSGKNPVVLCYRSTAEQLKGCNTVSLGETDSEAANRIFGALRSAEKTFDIIYMEMCGENGIGESLYNRMIKSCGGIVIKP